MSTFVRVVEAGSLAAASRSLDRSVPALSRQLADLERELGTTLIVRGTRRHHVTDTGRLWYQHCVRILGDVALARQSVKPGSVEGRLSVSASFTIGMHCVVPALPALSAVHPRLQVELRLEDDVVDLVAKGIDVVIRAGHALEASSTLVARPLLQFERWVVAAPAVAGADRLLRRPEDLRSRPCIVQLGGAGPVRTWALSRGKVTCALEVTGALSVTAPEAVRALAVRGGGYAWLPDWLVRDDVAAGRLVRVLPEWRSAPLKAWAVFRTELRQSPAVKALIKALQR